MIKNKNHNFFIQNHDFDFQNNLTLFNLYTFGNQYHNFK